MDKNNLGKHISQQFDTELEDVRNRVLTMGGLVEQQLGDALQALVDSNVELGEQVIARDYQVNEMEVTIDEELRRLIIHGLLHLLGYTDTGTPAEAEQMRECQESLVSAWTEPILGGRE